MQKNILSKTHRANAVLTVHVQERMCQRSLSANSLNLAFYFGRSIRSAHAAKLVIDQEAVDCALAQGVDIKDHLGIHFVCSQTGEILTAYKKSQPLASSKNSAFAEKLLQSLEASRICLKAA